LNAVEIEEAVSKLAEEPFDPENFPFAFLEAFGNKATTIQRLRSGASNKSDVEGGILQHNNIHIIVSPVGEVSEFLTKLRNSPVTKRQKAKFILATDGVEFQAEDLISDAAPIVCKFKDFPDHFGFFLPLAGISTVKQIRESSFDIKATGRLNRLYIELLKDNPEWGSEERRHDMNHFMARLIFCFFAEDTEIFSEIGLFTNTIQQMSTSDSSNTHDVIAEIFRAMNTTWSARARAELPRWADFFPYVNGGLFSGSTEAPRFSKIARAYLLNIGKLDWKKINPDIFGSMIQAVAEDEERGALGMHYTSVSNIRRVLNPLFLDDLRAQLEKAGSNQRMLLNLRKRISKIRVFDPACGSGNFLVIAYKDLREIEGEINKRRKEGHLKSEISLTNFRGIELRDFPAEVARLALIIAEYQCDVLYRGQKEALAEFLPLEAENWITCGNALRIDWAQICPIGIEPNDGETYICGNPPYVGDKKQSESQKSDMNYVFSGVTSRWRSFDYICGFMFKSAEYISRVPTVSSALVSTNSIAQGVQVAEFWPLVLSIARISFATLSFKWSNLAANNAGVICVIIGLSNLSKKETAKIFEDDISRDVNNISPYLTATDGPPIYVSARPTPISNLSEMSLGNFAKDGGNLFLTKTEADGIGADAAQFVRPIYGAQEFIRGIQRYCLWIKDELVDLAMKNELIADRIHRVADSRLKSKKAATAEWAKKPHRFVEIRSPNYQDAIIVPRVSSEERPYLPVGLLPERSIVTEAFALYDSPLWNMAIIASRLHLIWVGTVCGKMKNDFRYSNTLGWNTFPVPHLTEQNKADLTQCAEDILLAREAHFPATIADLYAPDSMPQDLRRAHERNDEVLERIYIGRRFKNDSERLERLFELYTKMVMADNSVSKSKKRIKKKESQV
jgi:hypothetical protein